MIDYTFESKHAAWEDRQLAEHLDGPEDDSWSGPGPVELIEAPDTYLFRSRKSGRYVTAFEAVDIMEGAGYEGDELGEARICAEEAAEQARFSAWWDKFKAEHGRAPKHHEWPKRNA